MPDKQTDGETMTEEETEDEAEEEQTPSWSDSLFTGGSEGPDFDRSPSTPDEGRVSLTDEEESVLEKIEELQDDPPEPYPHDEGGEVGYIPVGDSMIPYLEKRKREGKGFTIDDLDIKWWSDNGMMPKHPYLLLNPTTLANRNYHYNAGIVRDFIRAKRGDVFILADSGGFQLVNSGLQVTDDKNKHDWSSHIHPERVVEWQIANSDAGTILDVPVYNTLESQDDDRGESPHDGLLYGEYEEWFSNVHEPRSKMTREHAQIASDRVDELGVDGFQLTGVLHGMPRQDGNGDMMHSYKQWYDQLEPMRDWDGWSLSSPYEGRVGAVAALLGFAGEYIDDAEFIHVLGQGNVWARVIGRLYAQETDTFVTMDGTGFKIGSMFSTMYLPTTYMKSIRITDRVDENEETRYEKISNERMPCGCAVCRRIENNMGAKELFNKPGTERMVMMDLHNLGHLLRRFYLVDSFVKARGSDLLDEVTIQRGGDNAAGVEVTSHSEFWRLLESWFSESRVAEIYYAMDFVIQACRGNLDEVTDKYWFNTPFFHATPGGIKDDSSPSIWRERTNSVYDW